MARRAITLPHWRACRYNRLALLSAIMSIKTIAEADFNQFNPGRSSQAKLLIEEHEWCADDAGDVIGTLTLDKTDKDWGFVILGSDERGQFRAIDLATSIESRDTARVRLLYAMGELEKTGQKIFPQGD